MVRMTVQDILKQDEPRRMVIKMLRNVDSASFNEVLMDYVREDGADLKPHVIGSMLYLARLISEQPQGLRTGDTLARWGGDEFVVLLPDMPNLEDIRHVAHKLSQASREPVRIEEHSLPVTFSMGFTVFPDDGDDVEVCGLQVSGVGREGDVAAGKGLGGEFARRVDAAPHLLHAFCVDVEADDAHFPSEGEGDGLRSKKDRSNEDVVHLGQKTQPAREGVENRQNQGGTAGLAEPGREVEI
jgi:hypothetical protein